MEKKKAKIILLGILPNITPIFILVILPCYISGLFGQGQNLVLEYFISICFISMIPLASLCFVIYDELFECQNIKPILN